MITSTIEDAVIQMVVMERPEMRINLVDEVDEVDDEVERGEQHIWSPLLPSLP